MTEQEQVDLLAGGQAIADAQTLETLIVGGEAFADYAAAFVAAGFTTEDAAQSWRMCEEGE